VDGQNIGTLKKFLLADESSMGCGGALGCENGPHAIRQAADENVSERIELVEYFDGAERFQIAQLPLFSISPSRSPQTTMSAMSFFILICSNRSSRSSLTVLATLVKSVLDGSSSIKRLRGLFLRDEINSVGKPRCFTSNWLREVATEFYF
jgi:hypothetical protein